MADRAPIVSDGKLDIRPHAVLALGICFVGYGYLAGLWPTSHGYSPEFVVLIRDWVNKPLGIGEDFGFLGIAMLLVAGGMILTPRMARELALPLLAGLLLSAVIGVVGGDPLVELARPAVAAVLFTGIWLVTRRWPWLSIALQLEVAYLLVLAGVTPGASTVLHELGLVAEYLPLPVIGQLIRLGTERALVLGALCVGVPAVAEDLYQDLAGWWHVVSVVYAILLTLLLRGKGAQFALVQWLSTRAGWILVSVACVGYVALSLLAELPLLVGLVVALGLTGLAAEGGYRLAEKAGVR